MEENKVIHCAEAIQLYNLPENICCSSCHSKWAEGYRSECGGIIMDKEF